MIAKRTGRPKGSGQNGRLRHFRLATEADAELDRISKRRFDRPDFSTMMREAVADFIAKHGGRRK